MTLNEVSSVIKAYQEQENARQKNETLNFANSAYVCAYLCRVKRFPNIEEVFPALFGRTESGGIPADDWKRAKAEMEKIRLAHNALIKKEANK